MSKQSKKQKKRRDRQKRRQRQTLLNAFKGLYPAAPPGVGTAVVEQYLATTPLPHQSEFSNIEAVRQATLVYVRQNLTPYRDSVDAYIEAVLDHIAAGQAYTGQTLQTLESGPNEQATLIIKGWQQY